jgi:hypothetical protein
VPAFQQEYITSGICSDNAKVGGSGQPADGAKINGLIVCGVVMPSTAKPHKRKDGTGVFVIVRHELALQPGLAVWEVFHDPKDGKVKLDGENVVAFPRLPEFQQITLKVLRWEERDKRLLMKEAEMVA